MGRSALPPHDEPLDVARYVPVERTDTLARCNDCGSVVEGDTFGQVQHDNWHQRLDQQIELAARWRPAPRIR